MYKFKKMDISDLELLFKWLNNEHVKRWWDSEESWDLFYQRYSGNIESPLVFPHIVYFEDKPLGYINYWFAEDDENFKPLYSKNTIGTDQFIGELDLVGKGHGSKMVKQFTDELLIKENIDLVITDPDIKNLAAISCYRKAGFIKKGQMTTGEGIILLMEKSKLNGEQNE